MIGFIDFLQLCAAASGAALIDYSGMLAQAIEVLPTPPLPMKNKKRVGSARNPGGCRS